MRSAAARSTAPPATPKRCCSCSRGPASCRSPASAIRSSPRPAPTSRPARSTSSTTRAPSRCASCRCGSKIPCAADEPDAAERAVVRRLADQEEQAATTSRTFRIVADPSTGLRSATHFVGYIPTERAPEHFHTYDEVIYVIEGEGTLHTGGDRTRGRRRLVHRAAGADRALPREHRRGRHAPRRGVSAGRLAGGRVLPGRHAGIPGHAAGHDRMTHVVKDPQRRSSSANEGTHQPRSLGPDRTGRGRLREQQEQQQQ